MRRHAVIPVLALTVQFAVMGLSVAPASAQWQSNGGPICTEASDQWGVKVVDDGEQGMYVLWSDNRASGHTGLYLKRVGPDGYPAQGWLASGKQVSADVRNSGTGTSENYDMVRDPQANKVVIVWSKESGGSQDLFAQRVTPSGDFDWTADGSRIASGNGDQIHPSIRVSSGGLLVAFETRQDNLTFLNGVYFQRVSDYGTGVLLSGGVSVSEYTTDQMPVMAFSQTSGLIIAFQRSDGNNHYSYYAQKINTATGARMWPQDAFIDYTDATITFNGSHGMAMIPDGGTGAYYSWTFTYGGDGHYWGAILCGRLLSDGTKSWTRVNATFQDLGSNDVLSCVVPATNPSGATIVWTDYKQHRVMAVRLQDNSVVPQGWSGTGNLVANTPLTAPVGLKVLGDGSGGFLATWSDSRNPSEDIYAQKMTGSGVYGWGVNGLALTLANGAQDLPGIATDGSGGALVAWQDQRSGQWDIYGQRVTSTGQIAPLGPITITAPVGGEHWDAGSIQTVTWTGPGTVDILASPDAGVTWPGPPLAQGVQGGSASVTVPQWNSTRVIIKVVRSSPASSSQSGPITVLQPSSLTWSIWETSLEDVGVAPQSLAMALGAADSPNILFSSVTGNGRPLFAKPVGGWFYPENPLNQDSGVENPSVAVDANGNPHLSYIEAGHFRLAYLKKVDGVWSYEQVKPTWETLTYYNSLQLSPQGVPHIARADSQGRLVISTRDGTPSNPWTHPLVPGAVSVAYPSLAMNSQGEPRVTYDENGATNGSLRYVERTAWTWSTPFNLGNASYSSLAVDAQGNPKVAWYDPATRNLMYRERINNVWSTPVTVNATATAGQPPSLALDASGLPRIAHYSNGVLLYSWRAANGTWSTTAVDANGDAGVSPSLALNSQGNPRIAYLDAVSRRPRYAVSPADNVRPNEVYLSVTWGSTTAVVQWNAPGDDDTTGTAAEYDLRFAPNGISEATFLTATRLPTPLPGPHGQLQAVSVSGLNCGQAYAFMLKTRDESCNWGGSNVASGAGSNCGGGIEVDYSSQKDGQTSAPATLQFSRSTSNPSKGEAIRFRVGVPVAQRGAREELLLFDVAGRLVRALVSDAAQPGWRDHVWDLRTNSGSRAPTGVYFVRYRLGQETRRQTIVVTK